MFILKQNSTMKIKSFILILLASVLTYSCNNSVEKGTLLGRTASIIESNKNIVTYAKINIKSVIEKSGAFSGALPAQYVAFIKVYKESIFSALNMDKPAHVLIEVNPTNDLHKIYIAVEVKNLKKLEQELTELGGKKVSRDGITYFSQANLALAVKDNFGLFCIQENKIASFDAMKKAIALSEHKVNNEKLSKILNAEDDISIGIDVYRLAKTLSNTDKNLKHTIAKYIKDTKNAYTLTHINFNPGEAHIELDLLFDEAMKKYEIFKNNPVSSDATHSIGDFAPIYAFALNINYQRLFNLFFDFLPEKKKETLSNRLAMIGGKEKVAQFFTGEIATAIGELDSTTFLPKITVFAKLNKGAYLQSLVSGFGSLGGLTEHEGNVYTNSEMALKIDDQKAIYTTQKNDFKKLVAAECDGVKMLGDFTLGNAPLSGYIDFNKIDMRHFNEGEKRLISTLNYATVEGNNHVIDVYIKSKNSNKNILRDLVETMVKNINSGGHNSNQATRSAF